MRVTSLLLAGAGLLAVPTGAFASGFQVNLTGTKNVGMGSTGTGLYLDAASQYYNPASMVFAPSSVQFGGNMAIPRLSFRPASADQGQSTLQNTNVYPFSGFASFGSEKFKVGVGAYTPFGSELHYQAGWEGRYALTDITLQSVFVQATVAYAITPQLSIGGGLVWGAYGNVNLQRDIPVQGQNTTGPAHATLTGTADKKFGYNIGIMLKPSDKFSVGISYRSAIDQHVSNGNIAISNLPASLGGQFTARTFDVTLPLPDVYSIGFGVRPNDKLTLAFDANLVGWSRYQRLQFNYLDGVIGGQTTSISTRQYQDALSFRLGGQYVLAKGFTVRAGTFYDFTCVKDGFVSPETPDNDRIGVSAGLSYIFAEHFGIDASFLFEDIMLRSQSQASLVANSTTDRVAGSYKTTVAAPGVGVYYKF